MAGAYPGALDDRENELQLKSILNKGIDEFVCLQMELDDEIPEAQWRTGNGLRPYFFDARKLSKKPLIWRHLPIVDGCAAEEDDVLEALVCDLLDDIRGGRILYVHCWGGHGRAGIVVTLLLAVLYGLPVTEAFKRCQGYHDCRIEPQGVKSPSTVSQRSQVKRLLIKWANKDEQQTAESRPASAHEPEEAQVVVAKNGARGFVVPPRESASSLPAKKTREILQEVPLNRNRKQEPISLLSKPQAQQAIVSLPKPLGSTLSITLSKREISMHRSASAVATRNGAKAAGTGGAAIQMLRKSSAAKLALA